MPVVSYGRWPSPLGPAQLASARVSLAGLQVVGDTVVWSESRPAEGGRQVVLAAEPGHRGPPRELSPPAASVRSRVHEYGGGAFFVGPDRVLVYADADDHGLWRAEPGGPRRLSPAPPAGEDHRYGDARPVPGGPWWVAVRERHHPGGVDDEVVAVAPGAPAVVLAAGRDFYAAPRPSPDGRRLAYLTWDHPAMPWDATTLVVADLEPSGPGLGPATVVAGGADESVGQPGFAADGSLLFVSDRAGWWQPYRWRAGETPRRLTDEAAEFHAPDWVLGQSTLVPLDDTTVAARVRRDGADAVVLVGPESGPARALDQPCVAVAAVEAVPGGLVVAGATRDEPAGLWLVPLDGGRPERLRATAVPAEPAGSRSWAESRRFASPDGGEGHLLFYRPRSDVCTGPPGERPPVLVLCHGGPTAGVDPGYDPVVQFWTTRGVAVAAVDYRGSSGWGRAYRRRLDGRWGEADAQDVAAGAASLAEAGLVDPARMAVRGSSAGGLTALRAATVGGPFRAAVVAYGVTDLAALAADTHKFEAHYTDGLVGPLPEAAAVYDARSPARHPEAVGAAVLLLQGADDPVVPPDQAARMAEALRARGLRCDHVVFPGEGHGFRRAETLEACARLELQFLAEELGFAPVPGV